MPETREKYINPFTDFGFKRLFGEEPNKDLLLDFLNELLKEQQGKIVDLTYLKTEQLGKTELDRKAIFDLYCENERGEKFIVEMQKSKQNFFKDRSVYYSTFPIQEQAQKSNWNYELKAVYTVGILDFIFDADKNEPEKYRYDVKLQDIETNKTFYDKLTLIYFEMPKFNKSIDQLKTRFDKWLYVLKNLHKLDRLPEKLKEAIFEKVFEVSEIAKFTREEYTSYEDSLKYYRDLKNSIDTAFDDGMEKGIEKGMKKGMKKGMEKGMEKGVSIGEKKGIDIGIERTAMNGIKSGFENEIIKKMTGLTDDQINKIRQFLNP